eukprot:2251786-Pleurochrysis_carterae.AAC.2
MAAIVSGKEQLQGREGQHHALSKVFIAEVSESQKGYLRRWWETKQCQSGLSLTDSKLLSVQNYHMKLDAIRVRMHLECVRDACSDATVKAARYTYGH